MVECMGKEISGLAVFLKGCIGVDKGYVGFRGLFGGAASEYGQGIFQIQLRKHRNWRFRALGPPHGGAAERGKER